MKNTPLPPTLLRCVAGVPLMLVMRALAGSPARRGNSKLAGEWLRGVGACFWTARCSASKFDDAASARGRDFMMRTAGARIMSISGARRTQTSPGLPADAHDAGFWGAKMGMGGTTARWCTNSRCPHLAQPLNIV